jgi:hypothetical protein
VMASLMYVPVNSINTGSSIATVSMNSTDVMLVTAGAHLLNYGTGSGVLITNTTAGLGQVQNFGTISGYYGISTDGTANTNFIFNGAGGAITAQAIGIFARLSADITNAGTIVTMLELLAQGTTSSYRIQV